jgi:next-to-BRCA1 protein 1
LAINPDLLNYPSIFKSLVGTPSNPDGHSSAQPAPLSAVSVSTGVPSQVFPPGAEFVKTFRIKNDGDRPWPEATTLMFVLGEPFFDSSDERGKVAVGAVSAGATVDVWTGELKAPEAPGWYLGYWRLADGEGNFFGDTLWIDIAVVEMSKLSDAPIDAPESLASSSVIMPISAPSHGTAPSDTSGVEAGDSPVTALSKLSTEDDMDSDFDSDSVSLVSAPSARSDRGIMGLARGGYVVIDGSSGEE